MHLKIRPSISTIAFNDGEWGIISAFQQMGLSISNNQYRFATTMNSEKNLKNPTELLPKAVKPIVREANNQTQIASLMRLVHFDFTLTSCFGNWSFPDFACIQNIMFSFPLKLHCWKFTFIYFKLFLTLWLSCFSD